ncbi:MAG: amino acid adenylation domain-containing protein, partial [Candidatus Competibacteraceae bacterium]|nr:amino acid adenylation domain-containing protein [Candidatus Competibacteraceae bacterium]
MTRQYYPLTHPQKRIWFGEKLTPGYDFANIAFRITFQGAGNPALLSQAVNRIVEKNTGLRLHFVELEGEGDALANTWQYVADYQSVTIPVIDLPTGSLAEVDDWCLAESAKPFQLLDADLYQFVILKTADGMTLFGKFHHLIADGVSCWGPFVEQLTGFYASLVKKEGFAEKPIVSYLNFIEEEASYQASAQFTDDRRFWLDKFAAPMEEQTLYLAKGPASDISAASLTCKMPDELWQAFRQFSRQHKIPPFRLLLTGLYIYFARTSQRYDLLIDVAHHNRNNRTALQTIGMFVSTVPLRLTFDPECAFLDALRSISQELDAVLKGPQRFPYDLLAEELRAQHGTTLHSVCSISQVRLPEGVRHYQNASATTPLSLFIYPNGAMTFLFQRACFQAADIEALFSRLLTLLQDALAQPEQPLWQLNLLTTAEKQQLLQDFNPTTLPVPTDRTFPELFAKQVAQTPGRLALAFRDERYTYQELDAKTNALARVLQEHGVQPDVMVPILLHRSAEMLIAALAVMKAGGAYLPVDPDYPQPRIDFMLADSSATLLLSQQELREKAGAFTGAWLDVHDAALYAGPATALERSARPEHLAYVIYTSGSTGQPKGVLIEQRNLVNLCAGENAANGTTAEDAFANHYSFSFDAAVSCLFPPLLAGAAVHIIPDELRLAPEALNAYLEEQNITIADFPTQFGEQFMQLTRNRSLRLMLMGGDRLKTVALQPYTLVNAYGPTECTVTATRFVIDRDDYASIPIGRPVANTQAYVVDAHGQLQPIGIPGELWLAGAQVARGYWNRPELTAEKFIANPFVDGDSTDRVVSAQLPPLKKGGRGGLHIGDEAKIPPHLPLPKGGTQWLSCVYRTGDVVRWRPDGLLEFIGRSDFQVKIRGFRIELGDIEAVLQQHPDVADAAVISGQNAAGADFISAHAVLRDRQFGSDDAAYVVATIDQDPTLEPRMEQEHAKSWPAFFAGDKMNARYWRKLYTTFPQLQFALLADDHIIAAGNMTPFHWSGAADDLPQGWDDALERSFREHQAGIAPNAVCVLAGVVSGERKGQNVSYELLRTMANLAIATGHERIVLPVRPTLKTQYPHLSLQDYAALTRETDQLPFDPWLRVHTRLGGKILAYSEQSQRIEGTVAQWEEWTGQTFPVSGAYEIEGAMQPVMVDLAQDRGVYLDQAVWFEHDLNRYRDRRVCVTGRDGLRRFLAERLPDYMVPARIGIVAHIPTTTAGKVDRRALLATLPPEIAVERIAPRSEREHILARIWKEVLKLDDVGVNENFYHLGGDSIMSIQILSRARSQGLRIKGTDFFANPTIAGLAAAAETLTPTTHDRPAEGIAPLLPIQHWFFALGSPEPHHFNQAFCLKPGQPLEAAHLQSALDRVGRHHDALRLRFRRTATGDWEQRYAPLDGVIIRFTEVDLRPISEAKRVARRAELLNQLQCGFDLEQGPLAAAILVHGWTADEQRLLLAAHHLVVDVVSWRILLEDLESAYQALARGQSFTLPPRTAAYAEWGSALQRYADSPAGLHRQAEWAHITQHAPRLPRDRDAPLPSVQETATLTVSLPVALSAPLLEKPFGLYRARANDVLLTALALALFRWSGVRDGLLDLEGHGREEDLGPLDVSRTVGWFTSLFPVRLRLPESQPFSPPFGKGGGGGILTPTDLVQVLLAIKETLRAIPDNGISYGILRYLRGQPADEPNPELSFNYLGSLTGDDRAFLAFTDETVENIVSPATPMTHLLEIDGWETGGALTFLWRYSQAHFDRATIQALADAFRSSLEQLSSLFATAVVGAFSPADFPHTGLTQAHIDRFAAAGDMEDIYRLTPLQEGMLFQTCLHPEAGEYLNQTHWRFLESVDTLALRQAWSETMRRHPVFRSAFAWEDLPAPVQIVYADVDFEWVELDWRAVPDNQFALRFQRFLEQDRRRGFDLRRPGLTRITYIRRPDGDRLIWTDHHILTDGWCLPLLINELDERYVALCERRAPHLESAPPFARMIDWLFQQNRREAEAFWRQQLGDLETPTRLGIEKPGVNLLDRQTAAEIHERERRFPATLSTRCTEFARQAGCTVNTILQTAWAVALAVTSGQKDLTFGMVSSGRPEELPGVERIIGLFISTAPLRIRLDDALPAREALQEIAQTSREVNRLGFIGLEQIRALSGVRPPTPLFHSLFAFENYPVSEFGGRPGGLRLGDIVAVERADMPLALILFPGETITVRAAFDERLIEAAGVELLLDLYPQAIEGLLTHPDQALGALVEQLAQAAIQRLNNSELQFSDAENWRRQRLAIAALRGQQSFWTGHLGAEPPVLRLIPDSPRTESTDDQVAQVDCPLTAATVQALR